MGRFLIKTPSMLQSDIVDSRRQRALARDTLASAALSADKSGQTPSKHLTRRINASTIVSFMGAYWLMVCITKPVKTSW